MKGHNGEFIEDKMQGQGVYEWSDGRRYNGSWEENQMSGYGVQEDKVQRYEGFWKNGKAHGEGTQYKNGKIKRKGIFVHGKFKK